MLVRAELESEKDLLVDCTEEDFNADVDVDGTLPLRAARFRARALSAMVLGIFMVRSADSQKEKEWQL